MASFHSGNDRRDRTMREVTETKQYPTATFRATDLEPILWGRGSDGYVGRWRATGTLTFHGNTRPIGDTVDVRVREDTVRARAQFPISLSRFDVERPGFLGFSIGDTIQIDARLVAKRFSPAPK